MERVPVRLGQLRTSVAPSAPVTVRTADSANGSSASGLSSASAARVCRVCARHESRYTCPRCNTPFCGVACYQAHGEGCTERFFEQHVRDELRADGDARRGGVAQVLARERAAQIEDAEGGAEGDAEVDERRWLELARLSERGELSLDALTQQERARFLSEVADGRLGRLVALWSPWWLMDERAYRRETSARRRSLVMEELSTVSDGVRDRNGDEDEEEVNEEDEEDEAAAAVIQPEHALPARILTDREAAEVPRDWAAVLPGGRTVAPPPTLRFHLVEVLAAYARVLRVFNGDYAQDAGDAAARLLHLSAVLRADARYESLEHVRLAWLEVAAADAAADANERRLALQDAAAMLRSRVFVLDALRDARALVEAYASELRGHGDADADAHARGGRKAEKRERRAAARRLDAVAKKLAFFLMWALLAGRGDLEALADELTAAAATCDV